MHKLTAFSVLQLARDGRHGIRFELPITKPYENNLHHIVNDFVRGGEDYWLNIDADNAPTRNPLDLVEYDKDIIGCPYPIWHCPPEMWSMAPGKVYPIYWSAYQPQNGGYTEYKTKEGLQEVSAVATGCMLVARRVFEDPEMRKGVFTRKLREDGTVWRGNDLAFCERARGRGFHVWAHYGYPCRHVKSLDMAEVETVFARYYRGYR